MKITDVVTEVEMDLKESQNERDARVEQLWMKLDFQKKGELDWRGLQRGLRKIDHPLKNADGMLKDIIKVVDRNGDGKIQYEEFRAFVEAAERQLFHLFKSIDHDNDGRLDKKELQMAFQHAGLTVSKRRLSDFFADIDVNQDGFISFEEWRYVLLCGSISLTPIFTFITTGDPIVLCQDIPKWEGTTPMNELAIITISIDINVLYFVGSNHVTNDCSSDFLLFMPQHHEEAAATLGAVFTFYAEVVTLTSEGDSIVSDETLESLGTTRSLKQILFGSILNLASPPDQQERPGSTSEAGKSSTPLSSQANSTKLEEQVGQQTTSTDMLGAQHHHHAGVGSTATTQAALKGSRLSTTAIESELNDKVEKKKSVLIRYLPDPGYFVAGAVAGGISRTATAPLDRLKVYLLVNTTSNKNAALDAAKKGQPVMALKNAGRPLFAAVTDLYKTGGIRGFFAGNGLNVVKIMPETAIRFGAYEAAKKALAQFEGHGDAHHINPYSKFVAGGVAGMVAQFCVYPLDTLKFRLQSEYVSGGPRGSALLRQTMVKMWADGGLRATYRGVTMGLVGMFPYSAIDMGTFDFLKTNYCRYRARSLGIHEEDAEPSTFATGIMGATSGAIGASVVYPLNVLRTRLQTQGTKMHPARYTGIWDVAGKTIKNEGIKGLYKGLMPNLLKVAPALSITWMVYENAKHVMNLH